MIDRPSRYDGSGATGDRPPGSRRSVVADIGRPWSRDPARLHPQLVLRRGDDRVLEHRWVQDVCRHCGLSRREEWLLDTARRAIIVLVWRMPGGRPVQVRPFPWFKDTAPTVEPGETVAERYPGVEIGGEPRCPGTPEAWVTLVAPRLREIVAAMMSAADPLVDAGDPVPLDREPVGRDPREQLDTALVDPGPS